MAVHYIIRVDTHFHHGECHDGGWTTCSNVTVVKYDFSDAPDVRLTAQGQIVIAVGLDLGSQLDYGADSSSRPRLGSVSKWIRRLYSSIQ